MNVAYRLLNILYSSLLEATTPSWVLCMPFPESKVHGANMGPIWGRQDPGGPYVGPMSFAIWVVLGFLGWNKCSFDYKRRFCANLCHIAWLLNMSYLTTMHKDDVTIIVLTPPRQMKTGHFGYRCLIQLSLRQTANKYTVITRLIFSNILTLATHSSPSRVNYGLFLWVQV